MWDSDRRVSREQEGRPFINISDCQTRTAWTQGSVYFVRGEAWKASGGGESSGSYWKVEIRQRSPIDVSAVLFRRKMTVSEYVVEI